MKKVTLTLILAYAALSGLVAQQPPADGPRFTNGTSLLRPTNYREWPFIGSSLGLAYTQVSDARQAAPPMPRTMPIAISTRL